MSAALAFLAGVLLAAWPGRAPSPEAALLALAVIALTALPPWLLLLGARQPLGEDQAELRGWLGDLARLAGRQRPPRVRVAGGLRLPAVVVGSQMLLRAEALAESEPWQTLTHAARALAEAEQTRWPWWLAGGAGLGLGLALRLGGLGAVGVVLALVVAISVAGVEAAAARQAWVEQRAAELVGALRTERPAAFAELSRRQGLPG